MTPNEVRASQRSFEIGGAVACGLIFGLVFGLAEVVVDYPLSVQLYLMLAWDCAACIACYLGVYHLIDRYSARKLWEDRPNFILIGVAGTTLLFAAIGVPVLAGDFVLYPDANLFGSLPALFILWLGLNLVGLLIMMAAWCVGYLVRLLSK